MTGSSHLFDGIMLEHLNMSQASFEASLRNRGGRAASAEPVRHSRNLLHGNAPRQILMSRDKTMLAGMHDELSMRGGGGGGGGGGRAHGAEPARLFTGDARQGRRSPPRTRSAGGRGGGPSEGRSGPGPGSGGARLPDLCAADKGRVARLIQQLLHVSTCHEACSQQWAQERRPQDERFEQLKQQNSEIVQETAALRRKFGQVPPMLAPSHAARRRLTSTPCPRPRPQDLDFAAGVPRAHLEPPAQIRIRGDDVR